MTHPTKRSTRREAVKKKAKRFDIDAYLKHRFEHAQKPWWLEQEMKRVYSLGLRHARRERRTP